MKTELNLILYRIHRTNDFLLKPLHVLYRKAILKNKNSTINTYLCLRFTYKHRNNEMDSADTLICDSIGICF